MIFNDCTFELRPLQKITSSPQTLMAIKGVRRKVRGKKRSDKDSPKGLLDDKEIPEAPCETGIKVLADKVCGDGDGGH